MKSSAQKKGVNKMNGNVRKKQIINTSMHLFAKENYYGATTAKIAKAVGVTERTLYLYFPSKKDLFLAVLEDSTEYMVRLVSGILDNSEDPVHFFHTLMDHRRQRIRKEHIERHQVWFMAVSLDDSEIRAAVRSYDRKIEGIVMEAIRKAMAERKIRDDYPPEALARILISLAVEWMIMVISENDEDKMEVFQKEKDFIKETFLNE